MTSSAPVLRPATLVELLDLQGGVVTRAQARRTGMTEDQWQWRLDAGRWRSVLRGIAVAHTGELTESQYRWAARLAAGRGGALSGDAALIELGMKLPTPAVLHAAVPPGRRLAPQAFLLGQDRSLQGHRISGLQAWLHPAHAPQVLRVAPAVLHAAAWAPSDRLAEWRVAAAVQQRLVRPSDLRTALAQMPRLPRRALVAVVLDDVELGAHATSELEFLRSLRRHALPAPDVLQRCVRTGTRCYLDAWWERERVAVELDGAHHRLVGQWEADTLRLNAVVLAERHDRVLPLRFTPGHLRHDGDEVAQQLRTALL